MRDIWSYCRLDLRVAWMLQDEKSDEYQRHKHVPARYVWQGKAFVFSGPTRERFYEVINWCQKSTPGFFLTQDETDYIIWFDNDNDALAFRLAFGQPDTFRKFRQIKKEAKLTEDDWEYWYQEEKERRSTGKSLYDTLKDVKILS